HRRPHVGRMRQQHLDHAAVVARRGSWSNPAAEASEGGPERLQLLYSSSCMSGEIDRAATETMARAVGSICQLVAHAPERTCLIIMSCAWRAATGSLIVIFRLS